LINLGSTLIAVGIGLWLINRFIVSAWENQNSQLQKSAPPLAPQISLWPEEQARRAHGTRDEPGESATHHELSLTGLDFRVDTVLP
jgi:hypothetical protein